MDVLPRLGELSKGEFVKRLIWAGEAPKGMFVSSNGTVLFTFAVQNGLVDDGDVLVSRRKAGGGNTVKEEHVDDCWVLINPSRGVRSFLTCC